MGTSRRWARIHHSHLSFSQPPLLHQATQMKSVVLPIVLIFTSYSSEPRTMLRKALQLALTLEFLSMLYVFRHSAVSNCSTMQLVKTGKPKKLKMVDDLALSSKSGSTQVAINRSASRIDVLGILKLKEAYRSLQDPASFSGFFNRVQDIFSLPYLQCPHFRLR